MKKTNGNARRKKAKKSENSSAAKAKPQLTGAVDRRQMLGKIRNYAIGGVVVAGGGYLSVQSVRATIAEGDLSRVGQGLPTVVQVHDPNCGMCRSLQRETRQALKEFDENEVVYLVANILGADGRKFAVDHGVGHVTLLLFNAEGELQQTIRGVHQDDYLADSFEHHLKIERL